MSIFIKAGLWIQRQVGNKGELNLTRTIEELITNTPLGPDENYVTDAELTLIQNLTVDQSDYLDVINGYTVAGQDYTFLADWTWVIDGVTGYTNVGSVVINFPLTAATFSRIDAVVANTSNTFVRIAGVPSTTTPASPAIPSDTVFVLFVTIDDVAVVVNPGPPARNQVSNQAYNATTWNNVNNIAPSQNAVRDKIESMTVPVEFNVSEATVWNNGKNNLGFNTSFGESALKAITIGNYNSAYGKGALEANTTGQENVGIGGATLAYNTIGSGNTAIGRLAGISSVGFNQSGTNCVFVGYNCYSNIANQTNQIVIGASMVGNGSNTATLGNDSIVGTYLKGNVILNNTLRLKAYTVATLPVGAIEGDTAYITDATAPTYLGIAVGGGAVKCPVFFNGTNWIT